MTAEKRNAGVAPGAFVKTGQQASQKNTDDRQADQDAARPDPAGAYEVQVIHPVTGKPKVWDTYTDRERAESVAATLRKHKFFVQVRRVEVDDAREATS